MPDRTARSVGRAGYFKEGALQHILTEATGAAAALANEANLIGFYALFRAGAGAIGADTPERAWTVTDVPFPLFNSVTRAVFAEEPSALDAHVAATLAPFRARNVPMLWHVGPSTRPPGLGAALERAGLHSDGDTPGMAIDLRALPQGRPPDDLQVTRVEDRAEFFEWAKATQAGFGLPDFAADAIPRFLGGLLNGDGLRHYLGRAAGAPVATASCFYAAGVAGIYIVSTRSAYRGRGFGGALTLAAMREARDAGYQVAILQASSLGRPVYERLGFRECCRFRDYLWVPGG
jgi:GNAT superfamily N-acetyltransferase